MYEGWRDPIENFADLVEDSEKKYDGVDPALFCSKKWRWRTRWVHDKEAGGRTGTLLKNDADCKT
jgi:hypothetical protein